MQCPAWLMCFTVVSEELGPGEEGRSRRWLEREQWPHAPGTAWSCDGHVAGSGGPQPTARPSDSAVVRPGVGSCLLAWPRLESRREESTGRLPAPPQCSCALPPWTPAHW